MVMPHRLSLVRRMAGLRRQYTAETDSTVNPDMVYAAGLLGDEDRRLLSAECDRAFAARLLNVHTIPVPPRRIRDAVLPDATEKAQRALEASILCAVARTTAHLDHPAATVGSWLAGRGGRVLRKVRPQLEGLTLHVNAAAIAPLLFELLPRVTREGGLVGVPGLRAVLHRRCAELYVLDSPARVTLANLTYRQWTAAMAFADAVDGENPLRWLGNDPTPLCEEERDRLVQATLEPKIDSLLSALLRRFGLFATTARLSVRRTACDEIELEWRESPTVEAVAARLVHAVAGLPSDFPVVLQGDRLKIADLDEGWTVVLGRMRVDDVGPLDKSVAEASARWLAWSREMSRPNPTWPRSLVVERHRVIEPCLGTSSYQ